MPRALSYGDAWVGHNRLRHLHIMTIMNIMIIIIFLSNKNKKIFFIKTHSYPCMVWTSASEHVDENKYVNLFIYSMV